MSVFKEEDAIRGQEGRNLLRITAHNIRQQTADLDPTSGPEPQGPYKLNRG